jgi:hypothetical protein
MPGYDHKLTPLRDKRPIDRVPDLEYGLVAERQMARIQYGEIKSNPYIEGIGPFKTLIGTDPPQRI